MTGKTYAIPEDVIELSDLFRRAASFDDQQRAEKLVELAHHFSCAMTYIYHEYSLDESVNRQAIKRMKSILEEMAWVANKGGLSGLVLPLHEDHPNAEIIRERILKDNPLGLPITFRTKDYDQDLDDVGYIRGDVKTCLDEGVRGYAAVEQDLKYKWDRDLRKGGQIELGL